jgi:HAD superfamily hydrolase (TIGR01509 family)
LGGVIIDIDYQKTLDAFNELVPGISSETFYGKEKQLPFYSDYELGRIDSAELLALFNLHYDCDLQMHQFTECWNAMVFDIPRKRIALLRALRNQGKKIFLLSNINEIHEQAVDRKFGELGFDFTFERLFEKVYYSHRISQRKPNISLFEFVLNENGLRPEMTLFLDDSEHHVIGARSAGIQTIHLVKPETITELDIFKGVTS